MEAPKPLLKKLGVRLRQMMAEDWRGEDERNTLGMAGYWLEKLGEAELAILALRKPKRSRKQGNDKAHGTAGGGNQPQTH